MGRIIPSVVALAFATLATGPVVAQPVQRGAGKRALLVACTFYENLEREHWLEGPANDLKLLRDLLQDTYGFADGSIAVLDETGEPAVRPTRGNIEREFIRLARDARPGDQIVILLAGHGSQQPDLPPRLDEIDGLDEVFLPSDVGRWDLGTRTVHNGIVDDELSDWLEAICRKGAFVWLIADSCCSGDVIRGAPGADVERKIPPQLLIPADVLAEVTPKRQGTGAADLSLLDRRNSLKGLVALCAAQSYEPTIELPLPDPDGPYHGILTYHVVQAIRQSRTPLTYRQLTQRLFSLYASAGRCAPTPRLDGLDADRDRYVLDRASPPLPARFTLKRQPNGALEIDAGALHGLTVGSILAVYPEGGREDSHRRAGQVRVSRGGLRPLTSRVEPCDDKGLAIANDAPFSLPVPGRCQVVSIDYGDLRLRVAVDPVVGQELIDRKAPPTNLDPAARQRLTELLRANIARDEVGKKLIVWVDDVHDAQWLVRATSERADEIVLIPVVGWPKPQGDHLPRALGPFRSDGPTLGKRLADIGRAWNLLRISDGSAEVLGGSGGIGPNIGLTLLRFKNQNDHLGTPVPVDEDFCPRVGDLIGFRIENRGRSAVDLTLLWVDGEFGIACIFPDNSQGRIDNRIRPPVGASKPLTLRYEVTEEGLGREYLVAIAVPTRPLADLQDFCFLATRSFDVVERGLRNRDAGGVATLFETPLGRLVRSALYAEGDVRGGRDRNDVAEYQIQTLTWRSRPRESSK